MDSVYKTTFYDSMEARSLSSARAFLHLLWQRYQPASVVDVGCGNGCWLSIAADLGADSLVGVEGDWMTEEKLKSSKIKLTNHNLELDLQLQQRFDLVMSMEVAEHLSASRASTFVADLCHLGNVIIFSAAIPNQGGNNHINEQPQSYWRAMFESRGYRAYDFFRPVLWNDQSVEWWYRQNTLLYVNERQLPPIDLSMIPFPIITDLVHPEKFNFTSNNFSQLHNQPTLSQAFRITAKAVLKTIGLR